MDHLVFRLYGPLASWGEIAVGEARHSAGYPSRSAVLGLLAAALGIKREQENLQNALATGYQMAVKVFATGSELRDYHTTQAPDSVGKFRYQTRRDELCMGKQRLGTILSTREYRMDALALVSLRIKKAGQAINWQLGELKDALKQPAFHLYLGRKPCPLAAPLDPQIISAGDFKASLDNYDSKALFFNLPSWDEPTRWLPMLEHSRYYWEGELSDFASSSEIDPQAVQTFTRHDQPVSRLRWQFEPRLEYFFQARELS